MRLLTFINFIFFWLVELSPPIRLTTDFNHIKSKRYNRNDDISDKMNIGKRVIMGNEIDNEVLLVDELPPTNSN